MDKQSLGRGKTKIKFSIKNHSAQGSDSTSVGGSGVHTEQSTGLQSGTTSTQEPMTKKEKEKKKEVPLKTEAQNIKNCHERIPAQQRKKLFVGSLRLRCESQLIS
jgi:hypothetical protein